MSLLLSSVWVAFFMALSAPAQAHDPQTLTVAAASDLTNVEPALAQAFRKAEPKCTINWVTAASGVLRQQIENGAPYDLFLSANAAYADQLAAEGKLEPKSLISYAVGRVGVLWRDGKHHPLSDLGQSSVRVVAVPNPKLAPYGVAAQQALEHEGLWTEVSPKVVYGENVRQTLELFESGNADAVLTSDSLLIGKNPDVLPATWHSPIIQKAGLVTASSQKEPARSFLKFLSGPGAQAVFVRFGFARP